MPKSLREKMFREMEGKVIFEHAKNYAFDYADGVSQRTVFPSDDAITDLDKFTEALPQSTGDPAEILSFLNRYGAPATVAQTGGRYFGFVNGGVIPVALAARWLSDFWIKTRRFMSYLPLPRSLKRYVNHGLESYLVYLKKR